MDETRTIGIVLVNYNGMGFMPDCLASLAQSDYPAARIVIVDNASSDGSPEWVEHAYPEITLIRLPTNTGVTGGNNEGIRWCLKQDCDYVLLLNNDTVVEPDFLSRLVECADQQTLVTPKIYFYDNRSLINSQVGAFDYWRGLLLARFYEQHDTPASRQVQHVTMANTCALLIPRQVFERIGGMDNAYFMYYDDTDFVTRAIRVGGAAVKFVPQSVIYHRESSSSGGRRISPFTVYYHTRNRLYFMHKHKESWAQFIFFLLYFLAGRSVVLLRHFLNGERAVARAMVRGIVDYFAGTVGYVSPARFS